MPNEVPMLAACEVCGKPPSVHMTEVSVGSSASVKREHHYCWDHAPASIKRPTVADDLSSIEDLLAALEKKDMDTAVKAAMRGQLEQLREDVKAGRRRLTDAE